MKQIEKEALEALKTLYLYGVDLMPRSHEKYIFGVKYTTLRDDLKESIDNE